MHSCLLPSPPHLILALSFQIFGIYVTGKENNTWMLKVIFIILSFDISIYFLLVLS